MKVIAISILFLLTVGISSCSLLKNETSPDIDAQQAKWQKESDDIKAIVDKTDEYGNLSLPLKAQKDYKLKPGSAALVRKSQGSKFVLEGYEFRSGKYYHCTYMSGCAQGFLDDKERAVSLTDLKTLFQINCVKGKKITEVTSSSGPTSYDVHASICKISVFDLETKTMVAQKEVVADKLNTSTATDIIVKSDLIKLESGETGYIVNAKNLIREYLSSFR
jgi:hypothetical protein